MKDYRGNSLPRKVKGILFDFDGTLMDLRPKWWAPIERSFQNIAGYVPEEKLRENTGNMFQKMPIKPSKVWLLKVMFGVGRAGGLSRFNSLKFVRLAHQEFQKSKYNNIPLPGIPEMITTLKTRDYKLGIVSSASYSELKKAKNEFEFLQDLPIVSRDDVSELKPSPQPILKGSELINTSIKSVLYVGDFRIDIQAGKAAGCMTAAILGVAPDVSKPALEKSTPDIILESAAELVKYLH